jgi:hypothetical protein
MQPARLPRDALRRRRPAEAHPEERYEERPAAFDLVATHQRAALLRLSFGEAPPQIDTDEVGAAACVSALRNSGKTTRFKWSRSACGPIDCRGST